MLPLSIEVQQMSTYTCVISERTVFYAGEYLNILTFNINSISQNRGQETSLNQKAKKSKVYIFQATLTFFF